MILDEIADVQANAELLYSAESVDAAIQKMAIEINSVLAGHYPVVLCLMLGGVVTVGKLLPLLQFPLQLEYAHATRYQNSSRGGVLQWLKMPALSLHQRNVLIVDDILDRGITLEAMIQMCKNNQAQAVYTAVLVDKQIEQVRTLEKADFTGVVVPNRYVFGYGMDYKGHLRNAAGIYAVQD